MSTSMEMPRYKCHKTVHALKIGDVQQRTYVVGEESDGSRMIVPADPRYAPFTVNREYVKKHNPQPGGYYVVYDDGYLSFSPAEAFEAGYTLMT